MAITIKTDTAAAAPYTVTRAFYWAGDAQAPGTVLQLTKIEAADLLNANKVTPGAAEPVADKSAKPAKADKAKEQNP